MVITMKKRFCVLLLVTVMCLGLLTPAATAFPDINDQATRTAVTLLQNLGIVSGFPDGTFRPGASLTRAEFCTMIVMLSGIRDVLALKDLPFFPMCGQAIGQEDS